MDNGRIMKELKELQEGVKNVSHHTNIYLPGRLHVESWTAICYGHDHVTYACYHYFAVEINNC